MRTASVLWVLLLATTATAADDLPALNWGDLQVGHAGEHRLVMQPKIGRSRQANLRVLQVLGPNEMLVSANILDFIVGAPRSSDSEKSVVALLRVDTEGLVDDRPWDPKGRCFRVAETTTYETASGATATVFALEEITADDLRKHADAERTRIADAKWPARWAAERQTWRTRDGVIVDAVYDRLASGTLSLIRGDRQRFTLKLTELDDKSRRLALRLAKEAGDRK